MTKRKTYALEGDLRAGEAEFLRTALLSHLEAGDLRITTSGVTGVDASILQVLISARRTGSALGRAVSCDIKGGTAFAQFAERVALTDALTTDGR